MWKEMNEFVADELRQLRLKLGCGRVLYTLIAILLSIVAVPVIVFTWFVCLVALFLCGAVACACIPFSAIYNCMKEWAE